MKVRLQISYFRSRAGDRTHLKSEISDPKSSRGFTLIELLVALTILVTAMTIIWQTFSATVGGWQRGGRMLDELRHGDFVMEQLVQGLRSMAFVSTSAPRFGFRLKKNSRRYPADEISWVTSSAVFVPPDSPLGRSLHRVMFTVENAEDGELGAAVRAWPYLSEDTEDDIDPWFVSTEIKGIRCRTYNAEDEVWENDWEDTNAIPRLVEITLYMDPIEKYGEPVTIQRLVEIPVAPPLGEAVKAEGAPPAEGAAPAEGEGGEGAQSSTPTVRMGDVE